MKGPITERQTAFLLKIGQEHPDWLASMYAKPLETLSKAAASSLIAAALEAFPAGSQARQSITEVSAGHYAVPSATGANDLDFFRVDRPTEGKWKGYVFVKRVIGGQSPARITKGQQMDALKRIEDFGLAKAAALYGQSLGQCYRCNRHLTDDESRALGIGPECRKAAA